MNHPQGGHGEDIDPVLPGQHPAHDAAGRVILLDEMPMKSWGLTLVGFSNFQQAGVCDATNTRRFCAHFGVGPKALSKLYSDLATLMPKIDIKEFFLALSWLELYETEHVLADRWALSGEKIGMTCWLYAKKIQQLKERKVRWGEFEDNEIHIISVDGVHCRMQEIRRAPVVLIGTATSTNQRVTPMSWVLQSSKINLFGSTDHFLLVGMT
jgi:hypothetical protein